MKLKKVLSAAFATLLLSSSLCFASVSVQTVRTDHSGLSNRTMNAIYVPKSSSEYTQYYSNASGTEAAAKELAAYIGNRGGLYTPNTVLLEKLKTFKTITMNGSSTVHGNTLYGFSMSDKP